MSCASLACAPIRRGVVEITPNKSDVSAIWPLELSWAPPVHPKIRRRRRAKLLTSNTHTNKKARENDIERTDTMAIKKGAVVSDHVVGVEAGYRPGSYRDASLPVWGSDL